jgi:hypothetical protein
VLYAAPPHQEFIRLLYDIKCEAPARKFIHVILDNCGSHKHAGCAPGSIVLLLQVPPDAKIDRLTQWPRELLLRVKRRLKGGMIQTFVALQAAINRVSPRYSKAPIWSRKVR